MRDGDQITVGRTLLRIARKLGKPWRPIQPGLPRFPHPLALQLAHVAQWFHALSDTRRLHILEFLSQRERSVTELHDVTGIPISSVSFHLRVLRDSGLVDESRDGRRKYFSIRGETLDDMATLTHKVGPGKHVGTCLLSCCQRP